VPTRRPRTEGHQNIQVYATGIEATPTAETQMRRRHYEPLRFTAMFIYAGRHYVSYYHYAEYYAYTKATPDDAIFAITGFTPFFADGIDTPRHVIE